MTVYVVQDHKWVNAKTGQLERKHDLSPAKEHGEIRFLLKHNSSPFNLGPALEQLKVGLADFGDDDFLLLLGNPVMLGLAVAIAADYNDGRVAMLQWSGTKKCYIPVRAENIFPTTS